MRSRVQYQSCVKGADTAQDRVWDVIAERKYTNFAISPEISPWPSERACDFCYAWEAFHVLNISKIVIFSE